MARNSVGNRQAFLLLVSHKRANPFADSVDRRMALRERVQAVVEAAAAAAAAAAAPPHRQDVLALRGVRGEHVVAAGGERGSLDAAAAADDVTDADSKPTLDCPGLSFLDDMLRLLYFYPFTATAPAWVRRR